MRVGLIGAVIGNGNMGCVALTYSLVKVLKNISEEENIDINYMFFDVIPNKSKTKLLCEDLGIDVSQVKVTKLGAMGNIYELCRYFYLNLGMISAIKSCDFIIDITQGDSFTDIYGDQRFKSWTRMKKLVEKLRKPLVLAPQTYGPFQNADNREYAKRVIENADLVISRDQISAAYVSSFSNQKVHVTTDLAFMLPYNKSVNKHDKIKVGINVSALLVADKSEQTEVNFDMSVDYDEYIDKLILLVASKDMYEVHLIPHVEEDINPIKELNDKYDNTIIHEIFSSPIQAKNCIADMDVFIGARMHATIAAFSAGIATIPTAYSRKFLGLFQNLGYDRVIDLQKCSTDEALEKTLTYLYIKDVLQKEVQTCKEKTDIESEHTSRLFSDFIKNIQRETIK